MEKERNGRRKGMRKERERTEGVKSGREHKGLKTDSGVVSEVDGARKAGGGNLRRRRGSDRQRGRTDKLKRGAGQGPRREDDRWRVDTRTDSEGRNHTNTRGRGQRE